MMKHISTCLALITLFGVLTSPRAEPRPPHEDIKGTDTLVHYAHLHGDRYLTATVNAGNAHFAELFQCGGNWKAVMPDEPVVADLYIYAAKDRSVVVSSTQVFQLGPDCKPFKAIDQKESKIRTAGSYCSVNHVTKIAGGPCALDAPAVPNADKPAFIVPSTGSRQVNGQPCTLYTSKHEVGAGVCLAEGGTFSAFPSVLNPTHVRGLPVETERGTTPNTELRELKFDMKAGRELFAVPAGYVIKAAQGGGRR